MNAATTKARAAAPRLRGLAPVIARDARLVVLGSFPGEASLRAQQYYGHPRNQFWALLGAIWGVDLRGLDYAERLAELRRRRVGLWDLYASCRREGSLDQAIEAARVNDLARLRRLAPGLVRVAHNGGESARASARLRALGLETLRLPSSSPANASWSFARKLEVWRAAFQGAGL
ncbi:MAG: DNA-deoxyinosine glycosylase [Pseudomonadota bacterium]|nr:DNA-deoxyinosine glycosylase [Rubrivivax sp.]NLZ41391.1 DNA-deoxyinosine glycosylase [Comamonadaceae bacterium]